MGEQLSLVRLFRQEPPQIPHFVNAQSKNPL